MNIKNIKIIFLLTLGVIFSNGKDLSKEIFKLIDSDNNKSSILFEAEIFDLESVNGKHQFLMDDLNGYTMEEGYPQLPIYSTLFQISPDKSYKVDYEVIESYTLNDIELKNYKKDLEIPYSAYPEENIYVSDPQVMRDVVLNQIGFIPYKYYPNENKLEVYQSVKIHINESGNSNLDYFLPEKKSRVFEELYKNSIINYERSTRSEDYQTPSILYICGGSSCTNSYFEDLVEWRHKQGYKVHVVSTSESGNSENSINNYISNAYYLWENPPEIVGLVGDVGGSYNIACDYYEWGSGWNTYEGASDVKYTYIEGNDLTPEVVIGRISADSSSDLNNIINKTIQYEKAQLQTDLGWFDRSALIGDPTQSGLSCAITNQWIKELMAHYDHTDVSVDLNGGSDNQLEDFLEDNFNEGIMYYNYRGIYGSGGAYMPNNGNGLSNGYYTPFATVLTCGTGDYDYDDDSEDFIRVGSVQNPKGAVGCVGISTTGTHTAYNNILDMGIYEGIYSNGVTYAGSATTSGRLAMYRTYPSNPGDCVGAFSAWTNLMGDPALHLWTATPKDFSIQGLPSEILFGTNHLDLIITNSHGMLVEDARVTLLLGNDIVFESEYTNHLGEVSFNWDNLEEGDLYVTVTKRNYRPLEQQVPVFGYGVDLCENLEFSASPGDIDYSISICVEPIGDCGEDMTATLRSSSDLVNIINDTDLGLQLNFMVDILEDAVYGDDLNLILELSDANNNYWEIYIPFLINSPKIDILDFLTSDIPSPGESVDVFIQIENTGNRGAYGVGAMLLSSSNLVTINNGNTSFGDLDVGQIAISEEIPTLSFSNTIINGSILPLEIKITDQNFYSRSNFINITVGSVLPTDPLGPNPYGYYIYDSNDIDYELAPIYDWIEIDTQYGGSGQDLNLTDGGDGDNATNSTTVIDLPFIFSFYGDAYDQISINTNGWVALGETELLSFRNYPIPGAGGPSPMIAAFWDDMKTTSSGDVFYKEFFTESGNFVVIEWSDMRTEDNNSEEDFQVILYEGNDTPTGDGEIKVQYKEFNNTSNGYYPEGEKPQHGCYATIGIENKYGNEGLQYTFDNQYPRGASTLYDGSAIFITTQSPFVFYGDINGDEVLNVLDIVLLVGMILGNSDADYIGDMNQDGILNVLDVVLLVGTVLNG